MIVLAIDRVDINRTKDQLIDAIDYIDNNGEALDHAIETTKLMDFDSAYGVYSIADMTSFTGAGSVAIGHHANVDNSVARSGSIALGGNASVTAGNAIQIGAGSNGTENTVQIKSTQILNSNGEVPISSIENATDIQATLDKVENIEAEDLAYAVDYVNTNHASLTNASNVCSSIRNDGIGIIGSALGNDSIAIGDEATTRNGSTNAIVIGKGAKVGAGATGEASIAIGSIANVQGDNTIAIGRNSDVLSNYGVALGDNTTVLPNSTSAVALGKGASVSAENAVQIGQGTNSTSNTLQFKDITIINSSGKIPSSIIEGGGTGLPITPLALSNTSTALSSLADGTYIVTDEGTISTTAGGSISFVEGAIISVQSDSGAKYASVINGLYAGYLADQSDTKIELYVIPSDLADYVTQSALTGALKLKADKATTYTKTEVNTLLDGKVSSSSVSTIWTGTQLEYDAITTKDSDTLYFIVEASS